MLARIEGVDGVGQAWVSHDGNFVVVLPDAGEFPGLAVHEILAAERTSVAALDGMNRDTVLGLFADRDGWVRGEDGTAALSAEEAAIVGRRIAARVAARVPIDQATQDAIAASVEKRFFEALSREGDAAGRVLRDVAGLPSEVRAALADAMKLGWRALEGET